MGSSRGISLECGGVCLRRGVRGPVGLGVAATRRARGSSAPLRWSIIRPSNEEGTHLARDKANR